jgi:CRISPR type III-B/RAMP module RAMP protein Cmr6
MARIALAPDVAALTGPFAEKVENRSLLLDKFIFHKSWPVEEDERGRLVKWDEASRWSFMRLADDGAAVLRKQVADLRRDAGGKNIEPANRDRKLAQAKIAEQLSQIAPPGKDIAELRAQHTRRFISLFQSAQDGRGTVIIGKLEGRLAINLADGLVQNANISLDRLFGLPFIAGSAVKGVSRHSALEALRQAQGAERARLFDLVLRIFGAADTDFEPARKGKPGNKDKPAGDFHDFLDLMPGRKAADRKGAIAFLPAWPTDTAKIVVDLTCVHTTLYYSGKKDRGRWETMPGEVASLSVEKPTINPFPVVEAGARFAFAIVLNGMDDDPALLTQAAGWLRTALTVHGIGAKTSAGYGWFSIDDSALTSITQAAQADAAALAKQAAEAAERAAREKAEADRLAALTPEAREAEALLLLNQEAFALLAKTLADKPEVQQRAFLHLLTTNKDKRDRWKTWKRNKPEIAATIEQVRNSLGAPPLP